MKKNTVKFSRLLKVFNYENKNAYIVEMEDSVNGKEIYISYFVNNKNKDRVFKKINLIDKNEGIFKFTKNIPCQCIIQEQEDLTGLFSFSPITEFNLDCPNLKIADLMFCKSKITEFNSLMPNLKSADLMFWGSEIKTINVPFKNLVNAYCMFGDSKIEACFSKMPKIESFSFIFINSNIKKVDDSILKKIYTDSEYDSYSKEFIKNYPFLFI